MRNSPSPYRGQALAREGEAGDVVGYSQGGTRMHISYSFAGQTLTLCAVAGFPISDLRTVLIEALADPLRPILCGTLFDVRKSGSFSTRTMREIEATASSFTEFAAQLGRVALLATTDVSYGLLRMIRGRSETEAFEVEVFRDEPSAARWLASGVGTCVGA
jgi:hypothetical protein